MMRSMKGKLRKKTFCCLVCDKNMKKGPQSCEGRLSRESLCRSRTCSPTRRPKIKRKRVTKGMKGIMAGVSHTLEGARDFPERKKYLKTLIILNIITNNKWILFVNPLIIGSIFFISMLNNNGDLWHYSL